MLEPLQQFVLELVRALLVEELAARVRHRVVSLMERRARRRRLRRFIHTLRTRGRRDP